MQPQVHTSRGKNCYHRVSLSNCRFTRAAQLFSSRFVSESGILRGENDFFSFLRKSRFKNVNISVVFSKAPSAAFQISKVCLVAISHECTLNVKYNCLNSFVWKWDVIEPRGSGILINTNRSPTLAYLIRFFHFNFLRQRLAFFVSPSRDKSVERAPNFLVS